MTTVDKFCQDHAIEKIDVLKLDIEGAEKDALYGAEQMLLKCRPVVYCEMLRKHAARFGYHPNEIIDYMKSFGYKCFTFSEHKLMEFDRMTDSTVETNFFFMHEEKHKDMILQFVRKSDNR